MILKPRKMDRVPRILDIKYSTYALVGIRLALLLFVLTYTLGLQEMQLTLLRINN